MRQHEASRTLVKSSPELWAECSDAGSLGRHLDHFGEIRITRLEPETAVAWEGELASGTVRLEPSGWGTKVILTARAEAEQDAASEPVAVAEPEIEPEVVAIAVASESEPVMEPSAVFEPEPVAEPEPEAPTPEPEPQTPRPHGLLARFRSWLSGPAHPASVPAAVELPQPERLSEPAHLPEPQPEPEPEPQLPPAAEVTEPDPVTPGVDAGAALSAALDSLGQAHHRPFSRA